VEPVILAGVETAYTYEEAQSSQQQGATALVKQIDAELPKDSRAFTLLRQGGPVDEILAAAHEWEADLIVMGTHQRGAVARALLGSVSQGVLRRSNRPVLLVADVEG
jgi:nucleotide-binding universal stress UspA family protein